MGNELKKEYYEYLLNGKDSFYEKLKARLFTELSVSRIHLESYLRGYRPIVLFGYEIYLDGRRPTVLPTLEKLRKQDEKLERKVLKSLAGLERNPDLRNWARYEIFRRDLENTIRDNLENFE